MTDRLPLARWIALGVPAALLAGALGSEYLGGLYPCEMCHWQRWPHYAAVPVAIAAIALGRNRRASAALTVLAGVLIAASGAIGAFHAGVEYGWWEGLTRCAVPQMGAGSDFMTEIFNQPVIRCDVAPWSLWGISLAGWNALISLPAGLAAIVLAFRR